MKVYAVSTRTFFNENGTDYAMAVDLDKDIKLFATWWEAHKELKNILTFYRSNFADHEVCTSTDDENFIMVFYNKYETVRYIVSLTTKEVK